MTKSRENFNIAALTLLKKSISTIIGIDVVLIEMPSFSGFHLWWKGNDDTIIKKLELGLQVKTSQVIYDKKLNLTFCVIDFKDNDWLINPIE